MAHQQPFVHVQTVTSNHARHVRRWCLAILEQKQRPQSMLVLDNASTDGTATRLRRDFPEVHVLENAKNHGMAAAQNQGITLMLSKWKEQKMDLEHAYVVCLQPDIVVEPDFLEKAIRYMEGHAECAVLAPLVQRFFDVEGEDAELEQFYTSDIIENAGISVSKWGTCAERLAGERNTGSMEAEKMKLLSGECLVFRAAVLEAVKQGSEYFDADMQSADVEYDLTWRCSRAGLACWFVPFLVSYKYRGIFRQELKRILQPKTALAVRNRSLLFLKNRPILLPVQWIKNLGLLFIAPKIWWDATKQFWSLSWKMMKKKRATV